MIPALPATINPSLGFVYNLQFKLIQEALDVMEQNSMVLKYATIKAHDQIEQAIFPKNNGSIEAMPMSCASGIGQLMHIQINVILKSPNHIPHDFITHNVTQWTFKKR